jgi:ASC-1-like (ASCH) protein
MHHVAIMNKSWRLIPKIITGEKTIESRWYQTKRTPWDRIQKGDIIYFKNSGEPITAQAMVSQVIQHRLQSLSDALVIVKKYQKEICLINNNPRTWGKLPKYCILLKLVNPQAVKAFQINKKGFGAGAAWITIDKIDNIRV